MKRLSLVFVPWAKQLNEISPYIIHFDRQVAMLHHGELDRKTVASNKECLPFLPGWLVLSPYLNIIGDKEWGECVTNSTKQDLPSQTVTISKSIIWR